MNPFMPEIKIGNSLWKLIFDYSNFESMFLSIVQKM